MNISLLPLAQVYSEKWKKAKDEVKHQYPSDADDIIHAFTTGIDKGVDLANQFLVKSFESNLIKAFDVSEGLFDEVRKVVQVDDIFLRANSAASFDVLFIIAKSDYLSEKRQTIYKIARAIRKAANEAMFKINFSFMSKSEAVSVDCLEADGYTFKHVTSPSAA